MDQAFLIYDPDCGFCRWCLGKVLAWDRHRTLRPVALGGPEAHRLLDGMPEEERMSSWHLADGVGQVESAGAAFPPLLGRLPGGAPLAGAAARFPRPVDRVYRWVAANRSRWGRFVTDGAKRRADRRIEERAQNAATSGRHQNAVTGGR